MNNEIIINNIDPQNITIDGGGSIVAGITKVYVNGVDVTVDNKAYVIVPTKTSELTNNSGFITTETDPTVPSYVKAITNADINSWNNKQNLLVSGTNIKTINSTSLLGSGNIVISGGTPTNVKVNGTSITVGGEADIITNSLYDEGTNPIATMYDVPTSTSQLINDSSYAVTNDINTFDADQNINGNLYLDGESNLNQYSGTEILNGVWTDGNDLYRKTFQTTLANNNTVTISTGLSSEIVYNIIGSCNNGIKVYPLNYYDSTNMISTYYDSGTIYIETNFDASGYTGFITLEYTKS